MVFLFQESQLSHRAEADERQIAAEDEEKLGSKVYALNKSPSSVHSELDASLIIAILTRHTKGRIALNYICWTMHSRWTLKARWPRVWGRGKGPPTRPQQQDWMLGVLLGRLIGEFPLNKLYLICLGTRAEFAFWGMIPSTRSQGNGEAHSPQTEAPDPLKNILSLSSYTATQKPLKKQKWQICFLTWSHWFKKIFLGYKIMITFNIFPQGLRKINPAILEGK